MIAATHGHLEMCKYLIESKAIIHKKKNFAATALHLACRGTILHTTLKCLFGFDIQQQQVVSWMSWPSWLKTEQICVPESWTKVSHFMMLPGAEMLILLTLFFQKRRIETKFQNLNWREHKITWARLRCTLRQSEDIPSLYGCSLRSATWQVCATSAESSHMRYPLVQLASAAVAKRLPTDPLIWQVAKNRRTFLAFPETIDPIDRQLQQVGAMSTDRLQPEAAAASAPHSKPARPSASRPAAAELDDGARAEDDAAAAPPAIARPRTSDVGNFTQRLGIRFE